MPSEVGSSWIWRSRALKTNLQPPWRLPKPISVLGREGLEFAGNVKRQGFETFTSMGRTGQVYATTCRVHSRGSLTCRRECVSQLPLQFLKGPLTPTTLSK
eukprot:3201009-Pleurochrysis_carterae.AAC.3